MSASPLRRPLLPSHYRLLLDPPDEQGDETLTFASVARRITVRGIAFREFVRTVVPLLDGRHTVEEILRAGDGDFEPEDLEEALALLAGHGLLREGDDGRADVPGDAGSPVAPKRSSQAAEHDRPPGDAFRRPQWNLWHDLGVDPAAAQARLAAATVAVVGLAGAGAVCAQALAAAGVGTLRLVDPAPLHEADGYLAAVYADEAPGGSRAARLAARLSNARGRTASQAPTSPPGDASGDAPDDAPDNAPDNAPDHAPGDAPFNAPERRGTGIVALASPLADDAAVEAAVAGADFVVCCLDAGRSSLAYRLNRVCLKLAMPWLAAGTAGTEVWIGPLMRPPETACFLCFRMRLVAASGSPERDYAIAAHHDRMKRDDSADRESLAQGEGVAGQLAALEATKALVDLPAPAVAGQLVVFDLLSLATTRHRVLRKPWCPACGALAWPT